MHAFFFTVVLGPLVALLPQRWRRTFSFFDQVHWQTAGLLSGVLEFAVALIGIGYWYMYEMSRISDSVIDSVASGKIHARVTTSQVSGAALMVFALHPLTWLLVYALFESAARACAAVFTGNIFGTLPLGLLDRLMHLFANRREIQPGQQLQENARSYFSAVQEHFRVSRLEVLPDALNYSNRLSEQFLEIYASRRKSDWEPPKTVRVDDVYYRLEKFSVEKGTRPFRYTLRRLERGVPGRSVLLYNTADSIRFSRSI
jgi:hypothetical protein